MKLLSSPGPTFQLGLLKKWLLVLQLEEKRGRCGTETVPLGSFFSKTNFPPNLPRAGDRPPQHGSKWLFHVGVGMRKLHRLKTGEEGKRLTPKVRVSHAGDTDPGTSP